MHIVQWSFLVYIFCWKRMWWPLLNKKMALISRASCRLSLINLYSKHACSQSSLFLWAGNGQFFGQNFDKNFKLWSIWDKSLGLYVKCKCQWRQFECWISKLNLITLDPIKGSYNRLYIFFISQFVNWQRNY